MPHLSLSLLGPFQARLDGEPIVRFESNKARALLAYLAVETDQPHRRQTLAGIFWPDWPESTARRNLRHALANLRQALGDSGAASPFLRVTRETIQFNTSSDHWVDVIAFQELIDAQGGDLKQAVDLYRGGLLDGFTLKGCVAFDDWTLMTRERLHRQAVAALEQLVSQCLGHDQIQRATDYAWHLVELAPWQEEGHRQLMRLLALGGQRNAALVQYETCVQILKHELDVEPTEETTRLYEQIRDGAFKRPDAGPKPSASCLCHITCPPR